MNNPKSNKSNHACPAPTCINPCILFYIWFHINERDLKFKKEKEKRESFVV